MEGGALAAAVPNPVHKRLLTDRARVSCTRDVLRIGFRHFLPWDPGGAGGRNQATVPAGRQRHFSPTALQSVISLAGARFALHLWDKGL